MRIANDEVAASRTPKYWPIWALVSVSIILGLLTFRAYGLGVDEPPNMKYGQYVIDFYRSPFSSDYSLFELGKLDYKGPAYFVAAKIFASLGRELLPDVGEIAFWHLAGFLLFQLAVFCIYRLALRWMNEWGAFGAALLFATQPLLWGHAFINPKDSPFMVLFLASVTFGLLMADHILETENGIALGPESTQTDPVQYAGEAKSWKGKLLVSLGGLILLALCAGVAFNWRKTIVTSLVQHIHGLASTNLIRVGFTHLAASPILDTIKKYVLGDKGFLTGLILLFVFAAVLFLGIAILSLRWPDQAGWFGRRLLSSLKDSRVVWAGVLLGLTVSIRVLGPYAGTLVVLWMIIKGRWKAVPAILAYLMIGFFVAYLTWPFLWANPLARIIESMSLMSAYPWDGHVFFEGHFYSASALPAAYIPTLMAIQLTEPVWILFAISVFVVGYRFIKTRSDLDLILLLLMWFVLPVIAFIAAHPPLYHNIRQLHFLLPPIFVFAGVAINSILAGLKATWLRLAILMILALPGILSIAQLFPYEYVYYNAYVGGPAGAFRRFDSDYWGVSSAEAAKYVNRVAEAGSQILVAAPVDLFTPYIREDLRISRLSRGEDEISPSDYLLIPTGGNTDLLLSLGDIPTVAVIGRQGMTLMIIKKVSSSR